VNGEAGELPGNVSDAIGDERQLNSTEW